MTRHTARSSPRRTTTPRPAVPQASAAPAEPAEGSAEVRAELPTAAVTSRVTAETVRTLVVWCQDWPVVAASVAIGLPLHRPIAVVAANHLVATSAVARAEGIRRGMGKRAAQSRCPELVVVPDDPDRDARLFEPVALAVADLAPGVEVVRPGLVAVPAKGPVGYFGGAEAAAERLVDQVAEVAGVECQVGVADGLFAATLAAHRGVVVPPGGSAEFLAPLSIVELDQPGDRDGAEWRVELIGLLRRLGLRTLGAFAGLSERDVITRFGAPAVLLHRLARGLEERPPARRRPPPELVVTEELDPPVTRVDAAAFAARALADRLQSGLSAHGLVCTRLGIHASTENGEELTRVWRCAEPLRASGIADRVRWQLDGWITGRSRQRPTAPIRLLRLTPEEVVDAGALQLQLGSGDEGEAAERAARALVHVQGVLGPDGVMTGVLGGGRGPVDRVRWVPWGDELVPAADPAAPWPGRFPPPSPPNVLVVGLPAEVLDAAGDEVRVSGRHVLSAPPRHVGVRGGPAGVVVGWAGPWPADERWWAADSRRCTRIQVLLAVSHEVGQIGLLLVREGGRWTVEGVYD